MHVCQSNFRSLKVLAALAAFVVTGCAEVPPTPTLPPLPDTSKKDTDTQTSGADLTGLDGSGEVVDDTPRVTVIGVQGLEAFPNLLCPSEKIIAVQGFNTGSTKIVLSLTANGFTEELDLEGTPDPDHLDRVLFTVDFSQFMPDDPDNIPADMMVLGDGLPFFVNAKAGSVDDLALNPLLQDQMSFVMDAQPPVFVLNQPDTSLDLSPLSGWMEVAGSLVDNIQVYGVDVLLNDEPLTSFLPTSDVTKEWTVNETVDIRDLPSGLATFTFRGRDACGLAATYEVEAKVIRWPQLRTHEHFLLPEDAGYVNQILVKDVNADGYPDLFVATTKGGYLSLNDSEAGFKGKARFHDYVLLVDTPVKLVAMEDLDNDGDLDLVTVETQGGGLVVAIYRQNGAGVYEPVESHALNLKNSTKVVDMKVQDLTNNVDTAPDGALRSDILIVTNSQDEALLFFKRQNADQPQDFDQCKDVFVPADVAAGGDVEGDVGGEIVTVCPTLFAGPYASSGVDKVTSMAIHDVTGIKSSFPDGFPEVIVGADESNQINTFANRFGQVELADVAFTESTISYVWLKPEAKSAKARYFCLGNFLEEGPDDPMDMVVGTEAPSTWRVLRGGGPLGKFYNESTVASDLGTAADVLAMVGVVGTEISGMTCGDFDLDGHMDFAVTSRQTNLLQVQLGNGQGRFNQLGEIPLRNPVNEGIGFVTHPSARNPQTADFDGDGDPDFIMDHGNASFSIYMNVTESQSGFELHATRALLTPLEKTGGSGGGDLTAIAIGDFQGDGKDEIVALTKAQKQPIDPWLVAHPLASAYRNWVDPGVGKGTKLGTGQVVYVWGQGTNGLHHPAYPAAYDFISKEPYEVDDHGAVKPSVIQLMDVGSLAGGGTDGIRDLVIAGDKTSGTKKSQLSVLVATHGGDFWKESELPSPMRSMFEPMPGTLIVCEDVTAFSFVNPEKTYDIPGIVLAFRGSPPCVADAPRELRFCPWATFADSSPFWECEQIYGPGELIQNKVGGPVRGMRRVAKTGPDAGKSTEDPSAAANLVTIHDTTHSLSFFGYQPVQEGHPYEPVIEKAVGTSPQSIDFGDLDGDGVADFAVAIKESVYIAFGQSALEPFTAPKPLDPGAKFAGEKKVVITDVNSDGWPDVVFTNKGTGKLIAYVNIGLEEEGMAKEHMFHGPIEWPLCKGPGQIISHAFDKTKLGCEDLVVLCEQAGAVAVIRNDGCE